MEGNRGVQAVGPGLLGCRGERVSPRCSLGTMWVDVAPLASLLRSGARGELPPLAQGLTSCRPVTVTGSREGGSRRGSSALSPLPRRWQEPESPLKCPNVPS